MARRRQARCTLWAGGELSAVGQRESAGATSWALRGQLECGRALNAAALCDAGTCAGVSCCMCASATHLARALDLLGRWGRGLMCGESGDRRLGLLLVRRVRSCLCAERQRRAAAAMLRACEQFWVR